MARQNLLCWGAVRTMAGVSGYAGYFSNDVTPTIPEERVLRVRAAGFSRRFAAAAADAAIIAGVSALVTIVAALILQIPLPRSKEIGPDMLVAGLLDRNPMAVGAMGLFFGLGGLYQIYLGGMVGQTIGKRWMGLRVISIHGVSPSPTRSILRYLAMLLSVMPAGLGFFWALFDRERRAAHDHLAGTYVIVDDA
jgi:uncharacterized RDD family membrane protein YckC